jgi:hypothetical protein
MAVTVWSGPGLKARRADQQCEHDRAHRRQLSDGYVTVASDDPGVDREGQGRPFEWQLREVPEQSALPEAQLESDRGGAGGGEGRNDEVAGAAAETALREEEDE